MPVFNVGSAVINRAVSTDYRIAALEGYFTNGSPLIWQNKNITYSFPANGAMFATNYGRGELQSGSWSPFSEPQQVAARKALNAWAAVANITFTEVADGNTVGDMRFGFSHTVVSGNAAYAYGPSTFPHGGDVWFNASRAFLSFSEGTENYHLMLHEIGHALGLSHPFSSPGETRSTAALPSSENNHANTVMSYNITGTGWPLTPMLYDIRAIQHLYGASTSSNGNNVYKIDLAAINNSTIWDSGGIDTIEITNTTNAVHSNMSTYAVDIDLNKTTLAIQSNSIGLLRVDLADGVIIENVIGTRFNDRIFGNAANNTFYGKAGDDYILGMQGIDTVVYEGPKSQHSIVGSQYSSDKTNTITQFNVYKPIGFDYLAGVERLRFTDTNVAMDWNGNAGAVAKIIGAGLGRSFVSNKQYMGYGLEFLDAGNSSHNLMQLVLNAKLGANYSNTAVINLLFTNLVGSAPSVADLNALRGSLDSGAMTSVGLALLAADHAQNLTNINLVGLAATGIEYI